MDDLFDNLSRESEYIYVRQIDNVSLLLFDKTFCSNTNFAYRICFELHFISLGSNENTNIMLILALCNHVYCITYTDINIMVDL